MIAASVVDLALREGAAQKPRELASFVDWLQSRGPLRTVLEIGTLRGGTLAAWCAIAETSAQIISVDLPGGEWGGGYSPADEPRIRGLARDGQSLTLIAGDSHTDATLDAVRSALCGTEVDLLFIDGDHSYDGVWQDFTDYSLLVRSGGVVAFHDILPHPHVPGCRVDRAWRDLKPAYHHVEFLDPSDVHPEWGQWGGLGALVIPGEGDLA